MLNVRYRRAEGEFLQSAEFHVVDGNTPLSMQLRAKPLGVEVIQADGHELQAILDQFENLLHHKGARVQVFRGDTARFIYEHLVL